MMLFQTQSMRSYYKMSFETAARRADDAAGLLVANGALGCAVERGAKLGPRSNKTVALEAYFDRLGPARERAIRRVMEAAGMVARDHGNRAARIVDPGWTTMWKERFRPLRVGAHFLIVPPWNRTCEADRVSIVINPGQAFGTGHHPTTAGAIDAIERLCAEGGFSSALDVGTGSGILAIAIALMGARSVTAIDHDPEALVNARENAALNRIARRISFSNTPIERVRGRFDLVTANILSSVLIRMAPELKRVLTGGGRLVLGGILRRESKSVAAAFAPDLRLLETTIRRGWATMVFAR